MVRSSVCRLSSLAVRFLKVPPPLLSLSLLRPFSSFSSFSPVSSLSSRRLLSSSPPSRSGRPPLRPINPCVKFTPLGGRYLRFLLDEAPSDAPKPSAIVLRYGHSTSGLNRMVFSFSYMSEASFDDAVRRGSGEAVLLGEGDKKLFVDETAFMKVLGAKLDYDPEKEEIFFIDREGNRLEAN